ncbi:unnamed protein product [Aphanomyces euteiches]|uniref:Uncharacterized protein n=1 Tax=Aphanomyces euteiches TaxID=100861 RepID=A0A6G0XC23_9STRA|nr:hypothetical protein Ae201684_006379 [Aphanomyces euteiches]KAH9091183.1 hypothetical protein Ae201684P_006583 [Aphanomyces euteiches]
MKLGIDPKELIIVDESLSDLSTAFHDNNAASVQHLNVAFNKLSNLSGLQQATSLKLLNVMHNYLSSLDGIEAMTSLCVLKASNNKLTSLQELATMSQLQELWIAHNKIELAELKWLKPLTKLQTLVIEPNPCCREPAFKMVLLGLLPHLHRLDTTIVTNDMRSRASAFLQSHEGKVLSKELHATASVKPPDHVKPKRALHQRPASEQNNQEDTPEPTPTPKQKPVSAHAPRSSLAGKPKQSKTKEILDAYPIQEYIPAAPSVDLSSLSISDAIGSLPVFASSKTVKQAKPQSVKSTEKKLASRQVTAPPPAHSEPESHDPAQDDEDDDIIDMEQYTRLPPATAPPPPQTQSELVLKYQGTSVTAVTIRSDGSAVCRWPNNTIAVTVDKEPSGYRLFATFKDGSVALSFDGHGVGFVNYASGKTMLSTTLVGDGMLLNGQTGAIERQWARSDSKWVDDIAMKLTEHLGFSFSRQSDTYVIHVFFVSQGVRHSVWNGFNESTSNASSCDAVMGKSQATKSKKSTTLPKLKHGDLVSEIRKCTANL